MKVMIIIKATKSSEAGVMPSEKLLAEMGAYNEQLVDAGLMQAGEGLHPTKAGKRVTLTGGERVVSDGPFAPTTEQIADIWLWKVKSMDEALEWVKKCPDPMPGEDAVIEIRPVFDTEDFAESDPSGKLREQEHELRRKVEGRGGR